MAGYEGFTSMGMDVHAYVGFAWVGHVSHRCLGLYSSRIFILLEDSNMRR